jgi:(2Fe-2S) ferredoxin
VFYKKHIFFCTNQKSSGTGCGIFGGEELFAFAKMYLQSLDSWGEGKFRASKSGCLGRCDYGPVCVVYPDGVWYTCIDENDVKEIIDEHIINNKIVERLELKKVL